MCATTKMISREISARERERDDDEVQEERKNVVERKTGGKMGQRAIWSDDGSCLLHTTTDFSLTVIK